MQQVAAALAIGASVSLLAVAIGKILRPLGISTQAVLAALHLADRGTTHQPRMRGQGGHETASRQQWKQELFYRAAYILAAAKRIDAELKQGKTVPQAVLDELPNWRAHERARRNRQEAADAVDTAGRMVGSAKLGWYAQRDGRTTAECQAAHGTNFDIADKPRIGWPGAVHPGCRCRPGPPFATSRTVDEATAGYIAGVLHYTRKKAS